MQKELQRNQRKLAQVETDLNKAQEEQKQIELDLANPDTYTNAAKFADLEGAYKSVKNRIAELNQNYEALFEMIMELENKV